MNRQKKMQKTMRLDKRGDASTKIGSELSYRAPHAKNEADNDAWKKKRSLSWKTAGEIA